MDSEQQFEARYPFVSVIMPVRNEQAIIAQSVCAVLNQTYPSSRFEIIIADGMSEDGTVEAVLQLPGANRVRIIANTRRIQAAGMNLSLDIARGDVIVRVDGHTVIHTDYVQRCVDALCSTGADNVGGSIYPVSHTTTGRAIATACRSPFAVPSTFRVSSKPQFVDTVYMGAWWRRTFDQIGRFDEDFLINEDYELNYRIRAAGKQIFYLPELRSQYYGQQTLRGLARQYFRYGYGKPKTIAKHPASVSIRHLAAPALVAGVIVDRLLIMMLGAVPFPLGFVPIAYLLLNLFFSIQSVRNNGTEAFIGIPLVFMIIHAAWGCGFWCGVIRLLGERFMDRRLSLP